MRLAFFACSLLLIGHTHGAEFSRSGFTSGAVYGGMSYHTMGVGGIGVVAASRPAATATQDVVRVYVSSAPWGASACRQDAFDIPKTETLMINVALTQYLQFVIVDDSLPQQNGVCQAVFIRGQPRQYSR